LRDAGPACGRILFEHAEHGGFQLRRAIRGPARDRLRLLLQLSLHDRERGPGERSNTGDHLVGHGTQRILVGRTGDLVAAALFGAHIRGRSDQSPRMGFTRQLGDLGNTEVGDDGVAVFVDENVRRLDVAMNYAGAVRVAECGSDLIQYRTDNWDGQAACLLDDLLQRTAPDVPHDEEVKPLGLAHRMD
jgi:hypothetical protein